MLDPFDFWLVKKYPKDINKFVCSSKLIELIPLVYNEHIVRSDLDKINKKYRNSDILIVGGGPSTNNIDWHDTALSVDYIWSCNHFFQNKKLLNYRIDLAMIMPGVDLNNENFNIKIRLDDTLIGFEIHDKWINNNSLENFIHKYEENCFFAHTKFFGKLGICARMLILAASLKAQSIQFIGLDGPISGHAFEPGKYKLPADVTEENADKIYSYQYDILWNYLKENFVNTKISCLDKNNKYHKKL